MVLELTGLLCLRPHWWRLSWVGLRSPGPFLAGRLLGVWLVLTRSIRLCALWLWRLVEL